MFLHECTHCKSILGVNDETLKSTWQSCPVCREKIYLSSNHDGKINMISPSLKASASTIPLWLIVLIVIVLVVLPLIAILVNTCSYLHEADEIKREVWQSNNEYDREMRKIERELKSAEAEYDREMKKIERELKAAEEEYEREMRNIDSYDSYDF